MIIFLDSGPLAQLTNPKTPPQTLAILSWASSMHQAGHRFVVPAIADYEVRRELERSGKVVSLIALDTWNNADPRRFLPMTNSALRLASKLWAQARNSGAPTADPKELDGDVLIAAQAIDMGFPISSFIVATVNVSHISRFVPADEWKNIRP